MKFACGPKKYDILLKEIEVAELKLKSSERADTIEQMRLNQ